MKYCDDPISFHRNHDSLTAPPRHAAGGALGPWLLRAGLLAALTSTGVAGCVDNTSHAAPVEAPEAFPVSTPTPAEAVYQRKYVGRVYAAQHAELRSRLSGLIEKVAVDEGEAVKAGQLLFTINSRALQQSLLEARAATKSALAELQALELERQNVQMLHEKHIVSSAELALTNAKVQALEARVEEAKALAVQAEVTLALASVRAPFDGNVNRIPRKAGSVVGEHELLTSLSNAREVFVYFRVSELDYLQWKVEQQQGQSRTAKLELADGSVYGHAGVIDAVESEFDPETSNIALRARFSNPDGVLIHGSSGKVVLETQVQDALTVPQKSTFEIQGDLYVFALDSEDRAYARKIMPRLRLPEAFVLESGLTPQDRFVVEGAQRVKEGAKVRPLPPS